MWQILHDAGIDPAPRRSGPSGRQFLTAQAKAVLAVDVVPVDTVVLRRISALVALEHGSRRAFLVAVNAHPSGAWSTQAARTLLMDLGDRASTLTFLLGDHDSGPASERSGRRPRLTQKEKVLTDSQTPEPDSDDRA